MIPQLLVRNVLNKTMHLRTCASSNVSRKAVIFDLGGVVIPSAVPIISQFTKYNGLSMSETKSLLFNDGDQSLWGQLECGQIDFNEFSQKLQTHSQMILGRTVDDTITTSMIKFLKACKPYPEMIKAIKLIKDNGIKTAALSNTFLFDRNLEWELPIDKSIFDVVVESHRLSMRKPNPEIYKYVLNKLEVHPSEAVFLDDLGANVKAARQLGMTTIKVDNIRNALSDLSNILNIDILEIPGTVEATGRHALSVDALKSYLAKILGYEESFLVVRKFKHGQSNPTYYLRYGSKEMVLRKKPPGKLLPSAHAVEREFEVMLKLGKHGVPVPNLITLCEDSSVIGTPFYLMDYVNGRVFKDFALSDVPRSERKAIYNAMVEVLEKIHSVDVHQAELQDYGKHGNYMERQITRWIKQYKASQTEDVEPMNRLMEWLPKHIPQSHKTTVVHGDFRLDNCIFDKDSAKVISVLDWELSTLGDPICDAVYSCIIHFLPSDFVIFPGIAGYDLSKLGIPSANDIIKKYCEDMGIEDVPDINVYFAFSFFRIAAILQGVYKRATQGQASSDEASSMGNVVHQIATIGCQFIDHSEQSKLDNKTQHDEKDKK